MYVSMEAWIHSGTHGRLFSDERMHACSSNSSPKQSVQQHGELPSGVRAVRDINRQLVSQASRGKSPPPVNREDATISRSKLLDRDFGASDNRHIDSSCGCLPSRFVTRLFFGFRVPKARRTPKL